MRALSIKKNDYQKKHLDSNSLRNSGLLQNWLTLHFVGNFETKFRQVNYQKRVNTGKIVSLTWLTIISILITVHHFTVAFKIEPVFFIPIAIVATLEVLAFTFNFASREVRFNDLIFSVGAFVYSCALAYITYHLPPNYRESLFSLVLLYVMLSYIAMACRFLAKTAVGVSTSVVWVAVYWVTGSYPSIAGQTFMLIAYFLGINVLGFAISRSLEKQAREQFLLSELLAAEREQNDKILHNALPKNIVERLSAGEMIADYFSDVAVVFADLVGFTAYSANRNARSVAAMLDKLFSKFDEVSKEFGLEKIKTIGDSYMAAAGVPEPCDDPVHRSVKAGVKLLKVIAEFNSHFGTTFNLRIGIHVGSVVGGIIGQSKLSYDIWGDVVNVASRLESTGIPGFIQVSSQVRERLGSDFSFSDPVKKELKGKGEVVTYFINI